MNIVIKPERDSFENLCKRPEAGRSYLEDAVREVIYRVRTEKDTALKYFAGKFDGFSGHSFKVTETEIAEAQDRVPEDLKKSIERAKNNIEKFHSGIFVNSPVIETSNGIKCWRKFVPVERVGLYVPGGSAPLFSTLLMLGIPAKIAGCSLITVCTPAGSDGSVNPVILYTASLVGITEIYKVGGAQAIAAMAYGTESIPKVYKIFGPGNQYVTRAKQLVQQDGVAIDMPAGPSEVLIVADKYADPSFIAADLISQAEHGPDSQAVLATDSMELLEKVRIEVEEQTMMLERKDIADKALEKSMLIIFSNINECIEFSNTYAPEHLILNLKNARAEAEKITNAGSVFIGSYSCESLGDYASGTNHTLPTNGYARNYSGVTTESFMKHITFQEVTAEGLRDLGPHVERMAEAESLSGHRNAVSIRMKKL